LSIDPCYGLSNTGKQVMEHDRNDEQTSDKGDAPKRLGRGWTERFSGPIRYRRYSDKDAGGRPCIFFKIEAPSGQSELATAVFDIIKGLRYVDRGKGGIRPTGLTFNRDRIHGRVYKLPDNPLGRLAADIIDAKLSDLAQSIENDPTLGR
jgi:hypothetical protein